MTINHSGRNGTACRPWVREMLGRHFLGTPTVRAGLRFVIVTDDEGNQILREVFEDRAVFVYYVPLNTEEAARRTVKDRFVMIGRGLTEVQEQEGNGEWDPGDGRAAMHGKTLRVEAVGPCTPEVIEAFADILADARRLLHQECIIGFVVTSTTVITLEVRNNAAIY